MNTLDREKRGKENERGEKKKKTKWRTQSVLLLLSFFKHSPPVSILFVPNETGVEMAPQDGTQIRTALLFSPMASCVPS